jgi:hypothetical protein
MVGAEALEVYLIIGQSHHDWDYVLIKESTESKLPLPLCEDTEKTPSMSQVEGFH